MVAVVLLIVWFLSAFIASYFGALEKFSAAALLAAGLLPAITCALALLVSQRFRDWTNSLSLRLLTLPEAGRILGGSFLLWQLMRDDMPAGFALPTGISDVIVGLSAFPAAFYLVRPNGTPHPSYIGWRIFSMCWLLASSASGMITSPPALTQFPASMVPVFFGPLMILLDVLGIGKTLAIMPRRISHGIHSEMALR